MSEGKPKVYVTGKIAGHTKEAVRAIVEEHGYQWSPTVSKNLTLLITGETSGPVKLEKAQALGTTGNLPKGCQYHPLHCVIQHPDE
jgi:NAD-dependent DNA ligase